MTGLGLIVLALAFIGWGGDWVKQAIAAYDRRTEVLRQAHQGGGRG